MDVPLNTYDEELDFEEHSLPCNAQEVAITVRLKYFFPKLNTLLVRRRASRRLKDVTFLFLILNLDLAATMTNEAQKQASQMLVEDVIMSPSVTDFREIERPSSAPVNRDASQNYQNTEYNTALNDVVASQSPLPTYNKEPLSAKRRAISAPLHRELEAETNGSANALASLENLLYYRNEFQMAPLMDYNQQLTYDVAQSALIFSAFA